jgi:hypothetical protein
LFVLIIIICLSRYDFPTLSLPADAASVQYESKFMQEEEKNEKPTLSVAQPCLTLQR